MSDKKIFVLVSIGLMLFLFASLTYFPGKVSPVDPAGGLAGKVAKETSFGQDQTEKGQIGIDGEETPTGQSETASGEGINGASVAISKQVMAELADELAQKLDQQGRDGGEVGKEVPLSPEEIVIGVMNAARIAIKELYDNSQVIEYSQGKLALRHPQLVTRQQVSEYFSRHFGQPALGLMNLFMIRNTADNNYTLVKYKGMTDILTADVEEATITSANGNKVVVLAQLADKDQDLGKIKVKYTISKDRAGLWKITGVSIVEKSN